MVPVGGGNRVVLDDNDEGRSKSSNRRGKKKGPTHGQDDYGSRCKSTRVS